METPSNDKWKEPERDFEVLTGLYESPDVSKKARMVYRDVARKYPEPWGNLGESGSLVILAYLNKMANMNPPFVRIDRESQLNFYSITEDGLEERRRFEKR